MSIELCFDNFYNDSKEMIDKLNMYELNDEIFVKRESKIKKLVQFQKFCENYQKALSDLNTMEINLVSSSKDYTNYYNKILEEDKFQALLQDVVNILSNNNDEYKYFLERTSYNSLNSILITLSKCYIYDNGENFKGLEQTFILDNIDRINSVNLNGESKFDKVKKVLFTLVGGAVSLLGVCFVIIGDFKIGLTLFGVGGATVGVSNKNNPKAQAPKKVELQDIYTQFMLYYYIKSYIKILAIEQIQESKCEFNFNMDF